MKPSQPDQSQPPNCAEVIIQPKEPGEDPLSQTLEEIERELALQEKNVIPGFGVFLQADPTHQSLRERHLIKTLEKAKGLICDLVEKEEVRTRKFNGLVKQNAICLKNLSSIFQTARTEIDRKNSLIASLQQQLGDLETGAPKSTHPGNSYPPVNHRPQPPVHSNQNRTQPIPSRPVHYKDEVHKTNWRDKMNSNPQSQYSGGSEHGDSHRGHHRQTDEPMYYSPTTRLPGLDDYDQYDRRYQSRSNRRDRDRNYDG